ncbi:hypothetical protein ACMTN4_25575 [Rhodococcus globerulus]|uniref:hypothetical protein n=1 Tax=Rhodococcus globerulus TaxID=33008 RepID=UPI0039ED6F0A
MGDGTTALVGRLVIDLPTSTVTVCSAAASILGETFVESVERQVNQPRRGLRDVRPEVAAALSAKHCNHVVLRRRDGILREPVVMAVEPPNGQSALIVAHVVDHSRDEDLVAADQAVLVDLLADGGADGAARLVGAVAERYGVDDYTASAILRYNAERSLEKSNMTV